MNVFQGRCCLSGLDELMGSNRVAPGRPAFWAAMTSAFGLRSSCMSKRINPSQFAADALEDRRLLSATIDVRVAGGGKTAIVESVGDVVELEVWGIVTGSNETGIDDDLRIAVGSFLSSGNGVKGTLSARRIAPFNAPQSSNGIQRDLDKDGDLD